jgi:uncharacterized membrane protein
MADLLRAPAAQAVLLFAAVLALVGLVVLVASKLRGGAEQDQPISSELLTKFRELHAKGVLSDEEYRTIKTKLATQLQQELKDSNEPG